MRYCVKHNNSYRPFILLVQVKNALSSVKAEKRPYLVQEKTLFACLLLLSVLFKMM